MSSDAAWIVPLAIFHEEFHRDILFILRINNQQKRQRFVTYL